MFSIEMLLIISLRETKKRINEVIAAETQPGGKSVYHHTAKAEWC